MTNFTAIASLFLILAIATSNAFTVSTPFAASRASSELQMVKLTYGAKQADFKAGSPLKNACAKLGVKPKYSCKKGDCGSCTLTVGGTRVKPCIGKVPDEPRLKSLQEKGLAIK